MRTDVTVRPDENADIPEETPHASDRLGSIFVEKIAVAVSRDDGRWQIGRELFGHGDRSGARTAATMWSAESLVWIKVHHVGAKIAGARDAEDGVHIRAIEVNQSADAVDHVGDVENLPLKNAQRIGVGDHEHADLIVEFFAKIVDVDQALGRAVDGHIIEPGHVRAGGVRSMRAVRREYLGPVLAKVAKVCGSDEQGGKLALGARGRL